MATNWKRVVNSSETFAINKVLPVLFGARDCRSLRPLEMMGGGAVGRIREKSGMWCGSALDCGRGRKVAHYREE